MPKQTCANCHFFIRRHHGERGAEHTFVVGSAQRALTAAGDLSWQRMSESIACFKGVWDEGCGLSGQAKVAATASQERHKRCYFLAYQEGMLLPAAEKLQQESVSRSFERRKYRLAIYGLLVTIIGLLAKLAYNA